MEETEFEHIAQEMRPRLTAHCQRYLSAGTLAEEADDIVQETLVKLWKMRERLSEYQSIEALGMTIARNLLHRPSETQQSPDGIAGTDEASRRNLYGNRAYRPDRHRRRYAKATQQGDGQASQYAEKNAAIEERGKEPR